MGGWVATRSAGQASTGYGKIEEMVVGLTCITPEGEIEPKPLPASAAGPQLRELLVGSEGVLGVITEATLRVRPRPAERRYEAWMFRGFSEGAEAFRRLEQAGAAPDVARLSDETETALSFQLAGQGGPSRRIAGAYMSARGYDGGCLAIVGFEGDRTAVAGRRSRASHMLRKAGGLHLGSRPGRAWERGRFDAPYLRDVLLDNCMMAETLETAAEWRTLMDLYAATREALRRTLEGRGTPPLLMCHISHLYPDGASLYFTFMAAQEQGAELEQWWAAKSAATEAILSAGGTLTHHHGVGRDHAGWLPREIGGLGVEVLRAAKQRLDPAGVMNPGKLVPAFGLEHTMTDERPSRAALERTLDRTLGIEVLERDDDSLRGRMPVSDRVRQPYGIVHGGALLALAETLASIGTALAVMEEGKIAMGQEISASYLRPISEGNVNAIARARRKGRTAWNWEVELTDDAGRLCTLVRLTIAVRDAGPGGPLKRGNTT